MLLLDELWIGNITPSIRAALPGSQYRKLAGECDKLHDQLRAGLSDEQKKLLEKLLDTDMSMDDISEQDAFICGVRIGAKFILDVLGEYPSQLPPIAG